MGSTLKAIERVGEILVMDLLRIITDRNARHDATAVSRALVTDMAHGIADAIVADALARLGAGADTVVATFDAAAAAGHARGAAFASEFVSNDNTPKKDPK